jgi:tRNA A-37 threonylcarbamoyl transferase component Bud32/Ca2+-binding EF-hand superfamily protein
MACYLDKIIIFDKDELYTLQKIWENLLERTNSKKGIDKQTFLQYIPLNGLLGDRLFSQFDSLHTGFIDFDNFINGLSILCLGSVNEQIKFLFDLCDVEGTKSISKLDLTTLLNYIPHELFVHSKPILTSSNFLSYTNNNICESAFIDGKDHISFEEFDKWIRNTPIILQYFKSIIPSFDEKGWSYDNVMIKHNSLHSNDAKQFLWKRGRHIGMIKRYYLLCGNFLYYYCHIHDKPKGIIFLSGSIVERVKEPKMEAKGYFGFSIIQLNLCTGEHRHHEKRILYCESEKECNEWIHKLQNQTHIIPFEEEYDIGKEIGSGAYSTVNECINKKNGEMFAVKIIDKKIFDLDRIHKETLKNEIGIMKLVSHPYIINMHAIHENQTHIFIVEELINDGDLFNFIVGKPVFKESQLVILLKQLLEAIAYLHEFGIVHCDIKPENILYNHTLNTIKLIDFGFSQMLLSNQKLDNTSGTISYVAPEMLQHSGYSVESDLWSVGVIAYLLIYGRLPFDNNNNDNDNNNDIIAMNILTQNPILKSTKSIQINDLISKLLDKNPKTRITAKQALIHPFFYPF